MTFKTFQHFCYEEKLMLLTLTDIKTNNSMIYQFLTLLLVHN